MDEVSEVQVFDASAKLMKLMGSSERSDWGTPKPLFAKLNSIFNFGLDVCANARNVKCARYYDAQVDGLKQLWSGNCFMNPPYGAGMKAWIDKAARSAAGDNATVVCLLPARTDTKWFRTCFEHAKSITFLHGRLKFETNGLESGTAPFPSCIVVFSPTELLNIRLLALQEIGPTWNLRPHTSSPVSVAGITYPIRYGARV